MHVASQYIGSRLNGQRYIVLRCDFKARVDATVVYIANGLGVMIQYIKANKKVSFKNIHKCRDGAASH